MKSVVVNAFSKAKARINICIIYKKKNSPNIIFNRFVSSFHSAKEIECLKSIKPFRIYLKNPIEEFPYQFMTSAIVRDCL